MGLAALREDWAPVYQTSLWRSKGVALPLHAKQNKITPHTAVFVDWQDVREYRGQKALALRLGGKRVVLKTNRSGFFRNHHVVGIGQLNRTTSLRQVKAVITLAKVKELTQLVVSELASYRHSFVKLVHITKVPETRFPLKSSGETLIEIC